MARDASARATGSWSPTPTPKCATAPPHRLVELVDQLGREAGIYLWYLAIVGGSAWKMEACLTRFARKHLADVLPERAGRGAGAAARPARHPARPCRRTRCKASTGTTRSPRELSSPATGSSLRHDRHARLAEQRAAAEQACRAALAGRPRLLAEFERLLEVNQRYAVIREEQARDFTLAWPVLRACARRLGEHLAAAGAHRAGR